MTKVVIVGAGPAGLTAGLMLAKQGIKTVILEADSRYVGGISKTVEYKGYCLDIGGHRFFSKSAEIEEFWRDMLQADMLERPRSSRIIYQGKFFSYPLKAVEAFFKLGPMESVLCALSYVRAKIMPVKNPKNFEDWVSNQFGKRLFRIFFKTYTEKVWGMDCKSISADWAAQRIKGLSLWSAIVDSLPSWKLWIPSGANNKNMAAKKTMIKTLITTFRYPRKGPGMMWDKVRSEIEKLGGK